MIDVRELRKGNYLLYTPGPENVELRNGNLELLKELQRLGAKFELSPVIVEGIGDDMINGLPQDYFAPINLTPEVLKQVGFETLDAEVDLMEWGNDKFSIMNDGGLNDERNQPYYFEYGNQFKKKEVRYLHQLQNLYFALTGEELKIDLTK